MPVIAKIGGCSGGCPQEGDPCDDGDVCTTGDIYDAACNCAGTFQDSDGDGICDDEDDCIAMTTSFQENPLTHSGTGSSTTIVDYNNVIHTDASFIISGLGSRTGGSPNKRYIDLVTVSYYDVLNNVSLSLTFSGADPTKSSRISLQQSDQPGRDTNGQLTEGLYLVQVAVPGMQVKIFKLVISK